MGWYKFRCVAIEETEHWCLDADHPAHGLPAFGIYLFREGEATYCCSLTPSQWCEWIQNQFVIRQSVYDALEESGELEKVYDLEHDNGDDGYYGFPVRDPSSKRDSPYISEPITIRLAQADYEDREAMDRAAWEEAREHFSGNFPSIPVLDADVYYVERAKRRAERPEVLPLFEAGDVPHPAQLAPASVIQSLHA